MTTYTICFWFREKTGLWWYSERDITTYKYLDDKTVYDFLKKELDMEEGDNVYIRKIYYKETREIFKIDRRDFVELYKRENNINNF